jgi:hypothetical protein
MSLVSLIYVSILFYIFIPGNFIELPFKTGKKAAIFIHALLFSIILNSTYNLVNALNILGI